MESAPLFLYAREYFQSKGNATLSSGDEELLYALSNVQVRGPPSWGAMFWVPQHLWSILKVPMYPTDEERHILTEYLQKAWPYFIPCHQCAHHFATNAEDMFNHTETGLSLFRRLVDMHNWVNVHIKGVLPVSHIEAAEMYSDPEHLCMCLKGGLKSDMDVSTNCITRTVVIVETMLTAMVLLYLLTSNFGLRRELLKAKKAQKKATKDS